MISVIIPAKNVANVLGRQLNSLRHQNNINCFEIIVVDNLSTDHTRQVARTHPICQERRVTVVTTPVGTWAPGARNLGADLAQGSLLVFCDADDAADPHLLASYEKAFSRFPGSILAGSVAVYSRSGKSTKDGAEFVEQCGQFRGMPYGHGCNFAIGSTLFQNLGGFDESIIPTYFEEVDLALRAQHQGATVEFIPQALMHKFESQSAIHRLWSRFICGRNTYKGERKLLQEGVTTSNFANDLSLSRRRPPNRYLKALQNPYLVPGKLAYQAGYRLELIKDKTRVVSNNQAHN
jgi:GT2 family glycosyltransferase